VAELSEGSFLRVIGDESVKPASTRRVVLCSGKVYYDLLAAREEAGSDDVALVRMELLYPFPAIDLGSVLESYGADVEFVWAQEEPKNMGAWFYIEPCFREQTGRSISYIGRPRRASPAEGYADVHEKEQKRLTAEAVRPAAGTPSKRKKKASRKD